MSIELYETSFTFNQDSHCMSKTNRELEELVIEVKSDLGHLEDGDFYFVMKTEEWAFDNLDQLRTLIEKISIAVESFKSE